MSRYNFEWDDIDDIAKVIADAAEILASRWWPILVSLFLIFTATTTITLAFVVRQYLMIRYVHENVEEENRTELLDMLKMGD